MLNWLRRLDTAVFSPPHSFATILGFVVVRLGLAFDDQPERESPLPEAIVAKRPKPQTR